MYRQTSVGVGVQVFLEVNELLCAMKHFRSIGPGMVLGLKYGVLGFYGWAYTHGLLLLPSILRDTWERNTAWLGFSRGYLTGNKMGAGRVY